MGKDIVCAEYELYIAANSIARYAELLSSYIESYRCIIVDISIWGINDDLVQPRLQSLAQNLLSNRDEGNIADVCEEILNDITKFCEEIESADNMSFPFGITEHIPGIVRRFRRG